MHVVCLERAVFERVSLVAGFLQVALGERVLVDDEDSARRQVFEVGLERRRVHRDEDIRRVARGEDVVVGEMELKARDAWKRAGRRPDLSRKVGKGGEVVPEHRRLRGEAAARELHTVARVPGEPDHNRFELLDGLRRHASFVP